MKSGYRIMLLAFFAVIAADVSAQADFKIAESNDNCIELSGTSTVEDWSMTAFVFSGDAVFTTEPGYYITGLALLHFSLPVTNLKSEKKQLDENAYQALKTNQFKTIDYKLTSAKITGEKDDKYRIATVGDLTVSGVTKQVAIVMSCAPNKNFSITCDGEFIIKMSDYDIEPPHFFDGLMSTGESVTIDFSMRFER